MKKIKGEDVMQRRQKERKNKRMRVRVGGKKVSGETGLEEWRRWRND